MSPFKRFLRDANLPIPETFFGKLVYFTFACIIIVALGRLIETWAGVAWALITLPWRIF